MYTRKYNHIISYMLMLQLLHVYIIQSAIIVTSQPTPSFSTNQQSFPSVTKCYGNFIFTGIKCFSCLSDYIAQSNRCIKLLGWGYGTNLIQPQIQSTSIQSYNNRSNSVGIPNCNRINVRNISICTECNIFYDLIDGKCIKQSCKIYSQVVRKCLDDLKNGQIQLLGNNSQNRGQNQKVVATQQVYIIGGPMSKMQVTLIDNVVSLTLPTLSLKIPQKQLQINENTEIQPIQLQKNQNITININNNKTISIIPGCIAYQSNSQQCQQCQQGYLLNILINQCKLISTAILFNSNRDSL